MDISPAFSIHSTLGQQALALVRGSNHNCAHVGGTTAIDEVMKDIEPFSERRILEVGCGLGGTAEYIRTHGWGEVTSIDEDQARIIYATQRYPKGDYRHCKAANAPQLLQPGHDLIISLHAFCALENKAATLRALATLASPGAHLRVFDFIDRGNYADDPVTENGQPVFRSPLQLGQIEHLLEANDWRLYTVRPLHQQFLLWHEEFLEAVEHKRKPLLALFEQNELEPQAAYAQLLSVVEQMRDATAEGNLGGALIMATRNKRD